MRKTLLWSLRKGWAGIFFPFLSGLFGPALLGVLFLLAASSRPCRAADSMVWVVENESPPRDTEAPAEPETGAGQEVLEALTEEVLVEEGKTEAKAEESTKEKKNLLDAFLAANPVLWIPWEDGQGCFLEANGVCYTKEGQVHAVPCLHYLKEAVWEGQLLSGFYYHDESGVLKQLPEGADLSSFSLRMGIFPQPAQVGVAGRVRSLPGILMYPDLARLSKKLAKYLSSVPGTWSYRIENLDTGQTVSRGEGRILSASMIKLFVMEAVYARMEKAGEAYAKARGMAEEDPAVLDGLYALLENMVCFSDNESFNELVRLLGEGDFSAGAREINAYLAAHGYADTEVGHTLHPSSSEEEGPGEGNTSSPADCCLLLSRVYQGACRGEEKWLSCLRLLLAQDTRNKIPAGLPEGVLAANKTGETDDLQHDAALVYGKEATLVICFFSEGCPEEEAWEAIRRMTEMIADYEGL